MKQFKDGVNRTKRVFCTKPFGSDQWHRYRQLQEVEYKTNRDICTLPILPPCSLFTDVIGKLNSEKKGLTLGENRFREFADKCASENKKLWLDQLGIDIDMFSKTHQMK